MIRWVFLHPCFRGVHSEARSNSFGTPYGSMGRFWNFKGHFFFTASSKSVSSRHNAADMDDRTGAPPRHEAAGLEPVTAKIDGFGTRSKGVCRYRAVLEPQKGQTGCFAPHGSSKTVRLGRAHRSISEIGSVSESEVRRQRRQREVEYQRGSGIETILYVRPPLTRPSNP